MRDTTRSAIIAGLAILAVAFAAATLDSTVVPGNSGPGGPGSGSGDGDGGVLSRPPEAGPGTTVQLPFLTVLLAILAGIATLALVAYMIVYWREALAVVLVGIAVLGLVFVLIQVLSSLGGTSRSPMLTPGNGSIFGGGGGAGGGGAGGGAGGGDGSGTALPLAPVLLVVFVIGLALTGAVLGLFKTARVDTREDLEESEVDGESDTAVGRAAGRAADRLEEQVDVDNEVYRAWREMVALLDVDEPDTCTPGEFATAAIEGGLGPEDVDELTRLFEDVRYGETRPTEEYERRAITVFRRIEDRYSESDS